MNSGSSSFNSRKGVDPITAFIRDIDEVGTDTLHYMLKDKNTHDFLKRRVIVPQLNKRLREAGESPTTSPDEPAKAPAKLFDQLYDKRGKERERALASTIALLHETLDHDDLNNRIVISLLYRCLHGLKKGSATEKQYALQVLSLLSVVVDDQDKMPEIYREVLSVVSTNLFLKRAGPNKTKTLDCLGLVTFFGANNSEETQAAMKVIWDFIYPKPMSGCDVNRKNNSAEVLFAAIRSWSFLLTTMEGWRLHQTYWKGAISFYIDLLEHHDDNLVHEAASTALALIFEIDSLDKFWDQVHDFSTSTYSQLRDTLRVMILKKLEGVNYANPRQSSTTRGLDAPSQPSTPLSPSDSLDLDPLQVVRSYLETLHCREEKITVCGKTLKISSVYRMIQLKFLMTFLGNQFEKFVAKEQKLWKIFEFNPVKDNGGGVVLYESTTEKMDKQNYYKPSVLDPRTLTAEERKKQKVRNASVIQKAHTQLRAKERLLSLELKSYD